MQNSGKSQENRGPPRLRDAAWQLGISFLTIKQSIYAKRIRGKSDRGRNHRIVQSEVCYLLALARTSTVSPFLSFNSSALRRVMALSKRLSPTRTTTLSVASPDRTFPIPRSCFWRESACTGDIRYRRAGWA